MQQLLNPLIQAQLQQLHLLQTATTQQHQFGHPEEKKEEEKEPSLGIPEQETHALLEMCGELPSASPALLPDWFHSCAAKNRTDQFKWTIIRKQVMNNVKYDDADVPLTYNSLPIISKRSWLGKDRDCRNPLVVNAMDCLTPFLMRDIDNDEVAILNAEASALFKALHTTVADVIKLKQKLKASVPTSSNKFMLVLKRYANLLFDIFSPRCPLYKCVTCLIDPV